MASANVLTDQNFAELKTLGSGILQCAATTGSEKVCSRSIKDGKYCWQHLNCQYGDDLVAALKPLDGNPDAQVRLVTSQFNNDHYLDSCITLDRTDLIQALIDVGVKPTDNSFKLAKRYAMQYDNPDLLITVGVTFPDNTLAGIQRFQDGMAVYGEKAFIPGKVKHFFNAAAYNTDSVYQYLVSCIFNGCMKLIQFIFNDGFNQVTAAMLQVSLLEAIFIGAEIFKYLYDYGVPVDWSKDNMNAVVNDKIIAKMQKDGSIDGDMIKYLRAVGVTV